MPLPGEDAPTLTARLRARMEEQLAAVQQDYPDGLPVGAPWVPARLGGSAPAHADVLLQHEARLRDWNGPGATA